jgi:hypothetical protein
VAAAACGGDDDDAALSAVERVHLMVGAPVTTQPKLGDQACALYDGGPPPIPPETPIPIRGTCRWEAERSGEEWTVSFVQTWSCQDFAADIAGERSCTGERGTHIWRYRLSADGKVIPLGDEGDFPPQWAQ